MRKSFRFSLLTGFVALSMFAVLFAGVGWFLSKSREAVEGARRGNCNGYLAQLRCAIQSYEDVYRHFPAVYETDSNGARKHSWRALMLRQSSNDDIDYRFDESWNSPRNLAVAETIAQRHYTCPSAKNATKTATNYVALLGNNSANMGTVFASIDGGEPKRVLVVEVADSNLICTEPRDLTLDQFLSLMSSRRRPHGALVGMILAERGQRVVHVNLDKVVFTDHSIQE